MALPVEISNFFGLIYGVWCLLPPIVSVTIRFIIIVPATISLVLRFCDFGGG